jgi:hypothetical protein
MLKVCPFCGADMVLYRQNWWVLRYECTDCGAYIRVAVSFELIPMGTDDSVAKAAIVEVLDRIALERPPH